RRLIAAVCVEHAVRIIENPAARRIGRGRRTFCPHGISYRCGEARDGRQTVVGQKRLHVCAADRPRITSRAEVREIGYRLPTGIGVGVVERLIDIERCFCGYCCGENYGREDQGTKTKMHKDIISEAETAGFSKQQISYTD